MTSRLTKSDRVWLALLAQGPARGLDLYDRHPKADKILFGPSIAGMYFSLGRLVAAGKVHKDGTTRMAVFSLVREP